MFARRDGEPASLAPDQLPDYVADIAHVAVRGYDATTSIAHAEIVAGADCAAAIGRAFGKDEIEYVHVRAGAYGCFQFRVDRAA